MIKDAIDDPACLDRTGSNIDHFLDGWRCLEERKGGVMNATGYCYYCNKKLGLLEECYPVRQELAVKQGALRFKAAGIACVKCVEVDDKPTTIFNKTEARGSDEI